ncbi:MAG TPA: ester cyclase [Pyrinomonadaceae bacterium]|nr:ester cyclase [Pyrinomonadaceae bacterium]
MAKPTNEEQNEWIVRRFYEELWNGRRLGVADELFAAEGVTHQLRSGAPDDAVPRNPATMRAHVAEWAAAFPDLRFEVEHLIARGDLVVTRAVMSGTHAGEWHGVAPTGRRVEIRMAVTHRIADGKIAEDWVLVDSLGLLQQLGLLPSTEEILARGPDAAAGDGDG